MTLKNRYKESIRPKLLKDLGLKNIHQVPKVVKVNVNRGLGEAASNSKALEASLNEMATITGQKALVTRALVTKAFCPVIVAISFKEASRAFEFEAASPRPLLTLTLTTLGTWWIFLRPRSFKSFGLIDSL